MKKFIAMLLALVMVLSLVACGDKKDDAAGTDDSDKDSQDTITLKMHFVDPETAPFVQGGKKIAELVSEATDGRIQIEVLAGGSLGGERDTVELAMDNSLDIAAQCADADAVLLDLAPMTAEAVAGLRKCKVISRYGVGFENVDLDAATAAGIQVTNVPDYCMEDVSEWRMFPTMRWR